MKKQECKCVDPKPTRLGNCVICGKTISENKDSNPTSTEKSDGGFDETPLLVAVEVLSDIASGVTDVAGEMLDAVSYISLDI